MQRTFSSVVLEGGDLDGWLRRLASRLRNEGMSLVGRAAIESKPGDHEYEDAAEAGASLERVASLLETLRGRLCLDCRRIDVSEHATFGILPKAHNTNPPKRGRKGKNR